MQMWTLHAYEIRWFKAVGIAALHTCHTVRCVCVCVGGICVYTNVHVRQGLHLEVQQLFQEAGKEITHLPSAGAKIIVSVTSYFEAPHFPVSVEIDYRRVYSPVLQQHRTAETAVRQSDIRPVLFLQR